MIKIIVTLLIIIVGLNYILMMATVVVANFAGYDTNCNPIFCTLTSEAKEITKCYSHGIEVDCSELAEWEKLEQATTNDGVVKSIFREKLIDYLEEDK